MSFRNGVPGDQLRRAVAMPPDTGLIVKPARCGAGLGEYFVDVTLHDVFDVVQYVISIIVRHPVSFKRFRTCLALAEPETGDSVVVPNDSHYPSVMVHIKFNHFRSSFQK